MQWPQNLESWGGGGGRKHGGKSLCRRGSKTVTKQREKSTFSVDKQNPKGIHFRTDRQNKQTNKQTKTQIKSHSDLVHQDIYTFLNKRNKTPNKSKNIRAVDRLRGYLQCLEVVMREGLGRTSSGGVDRGWIWVERTE